MKKNMQRTLFLTGAAAVAALFVMPSASLSYSFIGGSLGVGTTGYQRDLHVYNNASDSAANNDTSADSNYVGFFGAAKAVWKGADQWASDDVDAGSRFNVDWQGDSMTSSGGTNGNTVSWATTSPCGGGVLAYTETPINNGWRIIFCEQNSWNDLSGSSGWDIAGIMTHEYGHALGLGHTNTGCSGSCNSTSTMCAFACSNGSPAQSIENDDANGVTALYGSLQSSNPFITSITGSAVPGGNITINGTGFDSTVRVKFTANENSNTPTDGVVTNVPTTGTSLTVTVPSDALSGHVHVWEAGSALSNGYPVEIGSCPAPTGYGSPDTGSNGMQANISYTGTPSVGSAFAITGAGFNGNSFAVMFSGQGIGSNTQTWGTILVAGPGFLRTWTTSNGAGQVSITVPVTAAMVGTTINYQYVGRDPAGPFGDRLQHSAALAVTYCP